MPFPASRFLAAAVLLGALAACGAPGSASEHRADPTASSAASGRAAAAPAPDGLVGFGATDAAWNAHHREDTRFARGSVYDRDAGIDDGGYGRNPDRYIDVEHTGGRVLSYSLELPSGTTQSTAVAAATAELPRGATVVWARQFDTCFAVELHSTRLAAALPNQLDHGYVSVTMYRYDSSAAPLAPTSSVQEASLTAGAVTTPAAFPGC